MKTTNLIICSVIALFLLSSSGEIQSASALESNKKVICYGLLSHSSMGEFDSKKNTIVPCEIQPTFSTGEYAGVTLIGNGHTWSCSRGTGTKYLQSVTQGLGPYSYAVYRGDVYEVHDPSSVATLLRKESRFDDVQADCVAVDTRRNRLAVIFNNDKLTFRDLTRGEWLSTTNVDFRKEGVIPVSMIYRESEDCFYVLRAFYPQVPCGWPKPDWLSISKINADDKTVVALGRVKGTISLPDCGLAIQLLDNGEQLSIMSPSGFIGGDGASVYQLDKKDNLSILENRLIQYTAASEFNNKRAFFGEYYDANILPALKQHFDKSRAKMDTETVHVRLSKSGEIIDSAEPFETETDSGELIRMVEQIGKLPPLPDAAPEVLDMELTLQGRGEGAMISVKLVKN